MRVLLDTCVISELRKPDGNENVKRRILEIPDDNLYISVISIGEITKGVLCLADGKNKRALQSWLRSLERFYGDRILSIDLETVQIWGELTAEAQKGGVIIPAMDGLIAATARRHGLHVATRNTGDFVHTGVMLFNPWDDEPRKRKSR
ncbi:MAG: type II toxin-antitoxin system VapC family toxin [Candidatus Dadabacteria bacterium]|nr:MAG: type II toxin-antitoxin system VapC family toxin [Candidatus Dadabacteria bacterium]